MNISSKPLSRVKILIPVLIALIAIFNFTPAGEAIRNFYISINSPIKSAFWSRGITAQNQSREKERDPQLLSEIARLRREVEEADQLREALDLELDTEFNFLDSRVVSRATEGEHLIISRGSTDGVLKGMPVITSSRSLAGEVVEVLDDFSYVRLISHPETVFDGRVLEKDHSLGVVEGGEDLQMDMIDREADIEEDDLVVTHPGGGIYPGGIFIGEVDEVVREDAETFQSVNINPGFSSEEFQILFIITDF